MIRHSMTFSDFDDFYCRKDSIRSSYKAINRDEKITYKYYIYSRRIMREKLCNTIWEYLNAIDEEEMKNCLSALEKEYNRCKYE